MSGSINVYPEILVPPLGFENGDFAAFEGAADRCAKKVRSKDQIIGTTEQHRAAGKWVYVVIDHKMRDLLLHLAPALANAQLRNGVGHDVVGDTPTLTKRVEFVFGLDGASGEHGLQGVAR